MKRIVIIAVIVMTCFGCSAEKKYDDIPDFVKTFDKVLPIADDKEEQQYPLPLSVEAMIPRHAAIIWHSVIYYGADHEDIAVLYSVPVLSANGSLKYLELFIVDEKGSAIPRDRIYLGGRGLYVVDRVTEQDHFIMVHAREHQNDDPVCCPTRHINIIVEYGCGAISVSKKYTDK